MKLARAGRGMRWRREEKATPHQPNKFLEEALQQNKREGLVLAVKARLLSLVVIGIFLIYLVWDFSVIYYEVLILAFAVIGWAQIRFGRVERSRTELFLLFLDLALMTVVLVVPNPLDGRPWSVGMQYKYGNFPYFFVLLASAALAYSWRTLFAVAGYTTILWMGAFYWASRIDPSLPELSAKIQAAIEGYPENYLVLDPNHIFFESRIQEILIFFIVACILALILRSGTSLSAKCGSNPLPSCSRILSVSRKWRSNRRRKASSTCCVNSIREWRTPSSRIRERWTSFWAMV